MEEKKYEAGRVEISSAEYRDLVKEAVEARRDASESRSEKWKLESDLRACREELALANKKVDELQSVINTLQSGLWGSTPAPNNDPWWSRVACSNLNNSNNKENN